MQSTTTTTTTNLSLTPVMFFIILAITTLAHITADMYIPSLPAITEEFHATAEAVQFTLSAYLLGFGISHLFYGPISDRIGRKTPLLTGIGLSVIGGIICLFAPSVTVLIIARFLQGVGVGACNSIGRAFMRDVLSGHDLARMASFVGMIMVFVTASAPMIGGYLQQYFSFHAVFLALTLYTFSIWLLFWKILPETNLQLDCHATKFKNMVANYFTILSNKTFMGYTICMGCGYAGLLSYLTAAPFLLQDVVGLSAMQFGWMAFVVASGIFISLFINTQLVVKRGILNMVSIGIYTMLTGGLSMLILAACGFLNTFVIMLPIAIFSVGAGFTFGNASAGALHLFPKIAGSAGALFGCIQIIIASLASAITATLHVNNQFPLAMVLCSLAILSLLSMKCLVKKHEAKV